MNITVNTFDKTYNLYEWMKAVRDAQALAETGRELQVAQIDFDLRVQ